jgi:hypothetical protein
MPVDDDSGASKLQTHDRLLALRARAEPFAQQMDRGF